MRCPILILNRRRGEKILLPSLGLIITVLDMDGMRARLGFEQSPGSEFIHIVRAELVLYQEEGEGQEPPPPCQTSVKT